MNAARDLAESLTLARPDRFAEVREAAIAHTSEHQCDGGPASLLRAREAAVLVRATRASYVLELGTGLGYSSLHALDVFGRTGRLDTIESDPLHARLAEENFSRYGYSDRVRVYTGRDADVLAGLNGPYDLVILDSNPSGYPSLFEDAVRLLRTGGLLLANIAGGEPPAESFLRRLAGDDRLLCSFGAGLEHTLAVRLR